MALCDHYELPTEQCAHCQGSDSRIYASRLTQETSAAALRRRIEAKEGFWSDESQRGRIFRKHPCPNHPQREVLIPAEARQCLDCEELNLGYGQVWVDWFMGMDLPADLAEYAPYGAVSAYRR